MLLFLLISIVHAIKISDKLTSLPVSLHLFIIYFIKLQGFNLTNLSVYSGYLDINQTRQLHYIFIQNTTLNQSNIPLLVWMNGGPGCSSLEGFLSEIGPYVFLNELSQNLTQNPYSWSQFANLLFMESPSDVGYSNNQQKNYKYNDDTTAHDNLDALIAFFTYFPSQQSLDLWIVGESYAGVYIPFFANRILNFNKKQPVDINLKGIMIGNGLISARKSLDKNELEYAYNHYLFGPNDNQKCTKKKNFSECQTYLNEQYSSLRQLNLYNVYGYCYQVNTTLKYGMETLSLPCVSIYNVESYMNENKQYFNVDKNKTWKMCRGMVIKKQLAKYLGSFHKLKQLIGQIKIVLYSGDNDALVPYDYTLKQLRKINIEKPWYPYNIDDQLGGFQQDYEMGLTFFTVRGAGHMCPYYKRKVSYEKIKEQLFGS